MSTQSTSPIYWFLSAKKMDEWSALARSGATFGFLEETWSLAADMICRALFDREVPFNPHAVFGAVKSYTDPANHRSIRLKKVSGDLKVVTEEEPPAHAIGAWLTLPEAVISASPWQGREKTFLKMMLSAETDPGMPAWNRMQVQDEIKQYLWAGTETTALTLGWTFYLLTQHPDVADKFAVKATRSTAIALRPRPMSSVTYTRSVMLEALRLYPPAWALIRTAAGEDEIAGHKINAGDRIVLCPYVIHHDANTGRIRKRSAPSASSRTASESASNTAIFRSAPGSGSVSVVSFRRWRSFWRSRCCCAGSSPSTSARFPRAFPRA